MWDRTEILLRNSLIEKNVTFLFGAGASADYFSSLGNFEELLSHPMIDKKGKGLLKVLFFHQCIKDNIYLYHLMNERSIDHEKKEIMISLLNEYSRFLHNGIEILKVRNSRISPKRLNIITTNYDLFIEASMDRLLELNPRIYFNDGSNGYNKRVISTDNFNKTLLYSGVFDNYSNEMPSINLIKCHGSVNWKDYTRNNKKPKIQVSLDDTRIAMINKMVESVITGINEHLKQNDIIYDVNNHEELISRINSTYLSEDNKEKLINEINYIAKSNSIEENLSNLVNQISSLQIVLPTKDKFQTTLIQEHFFSMLRLLSYELEKSQSLLVVFGFSFQDEHITEIVQRSLNNPTLLVFVFCFTDTEKEKIIQNFNFENNNEPSNLIFIEPNNFLVKEIALEEKNQYINHPNYIIIDRADKSLIYKNIVSVLRNKEDNTSIPILNFSSLNKILETEIQNKFMPIEGKEERQIE